MTKNLSGKIDEFFASKILLSKTITIYVLIRYNTYAWDGSGMCVSKQIHLDEWLVTYV